MQGGYQHGEAHQLQLRRQSSADINKKGKESVNKIFT